MKKTVRPQSVDELTEQNVRAIAELDREARSGRNALARAVLRLVSFCGTFGFVLLHVAFFAAWILFNTWPTTVHFDPYPFTFLTLVVSLEAILLSTFVLISQNEEARVTERRNALDLQINLLTEQENTKMLEMLERVARKLGCCDDQDPTLGVLEQAMQPKKLAEQIDRVTDPK